jgi:hypothetical protein
VGVIINGKEIIDMLPVMDHRNKSITIDKLCSFEVNKSIQRATVKAIAMHGLGLSLWTGEDIPSQPSEAKETPSNEPKKKITLKVDDENWAKVLKYVVANKEKGLDALLGELRQKYSIAAPVKKTIAENL